MNNIFKKLQQHAQKNLKKTKQPTRINPMLATLTKNYFSDKGWIYERKLDGERVIAFSHNGAISLMSRNHKNLNHAYPELVTALKQAITHDCIIDGEVVAFKGKLTSFERLAKRMHVTAHQNNNAIKVYYYVFDLIYLDQYDVTHLNVLQRKMLLKNTVDFSGPIRFVTHRKEHGVRYHAQACKKGWEGIIAKKIESIYVRRRSTDWLKFKCSDEQELVIGGYTEPGGSRIGFGALLLGYYKNGELHYAGKVGAGFDDETLRELYKKLRTLERKTNPFVQKNIKEKNVHWVVPRLVGQIGFTHWTRDGKLRHPRFLGLRRDKKAKDVVREVV